MVHYSSIKFKLKYFSEKTEIEKVKVGIPKQVAGTVTPLQLKLGDVLSYISYYISVFILMHYLKY